jgi:hypothetical protein
MDKTFGSDSPQSQTYAGKGKGPVMGKEKSMGSPSGGHASSFGVAGGTGNHMVGKQTVKTQEPGQSASMGSPAGKYPEGGKNHMFGPQHAGPAVAGQSGHAENGDSTWGVKGGSTKMFGYTSSKPAQGS